MAIKRIAQTFALAATAVTATALLAPAASASLEGYTWHYTYYSDSTYRTEVGHSGCYTDGVTTAYYTSMYIEC
jgi:uncharacterized membrane protein YjgN (DUF898 family)